MCLFKSYLLFVSKLHSFLVVCCFCILNRLIVSFSSRMFLYSIWIPHALLPLSAVNFNSFLIRLQLTLCYSHISSLSLLSDWHLLKKRLNEIVINQSFWKVRKCVSRNSLLNLNPIRKKASISAVQCKSRFAFLFQSSKLKW